MLWSYIEKNMICHISGKIHEAGKTVSFDELLCGALQLSKKLHRQKYGILCQSDLFFVQGLLACFMADVTAIPLSNRYGTIYNQRIIQAMQIEHMIVQDGMQLVVKESTEEKREDELNDIALILTTSGTTGTPKGVMLSKSAILHHLMDSERLIPGGEEERFLFGRGFFHCTSVIGGLLMNLVKGTDMYCLNESFQPRRVLQALRNEEITMYAAITSAFYYLCCAIGAEGKNLSLKYCNIGGERMKENCFHKIRSVLPNVKIIHAYGMTEVCSRITYQDIQESDCQPDCVGRVYASMKAKIVDQHGNVLQAGERGKILLSGAELMSGYYKDSIQTGKVLKNGWLDTGDNGYIDENNRLYISNRQDEMIIRAGVNIYPQEIENELSKHEGVKDVLVYVDRSSQVTEHINADISLVSGYEYKPIEFMKWCKDNMPAHQVPDKINIVKELKLNGIGKMQRERKYYETDNQ